MDRYILFNPEKFLKDAPKWDAERKRLEKELESVLELTANENAEVHSGSISDPTQKTALKRLWLSQEINRIDNYQHVLEYGLTHITPSQRELIECFYFKKNKALNYIVDELSEKYSCSTRHIYRMKNEAVEAFEFEVNGII